MADDCEEYQVEAILDHVNRNGENLYLIKWDGYNSDQNSWEPESNLNCPGLLREFLEKKRKEEESDDSDSIVNHRKGKKTRSKRKKSTVTRSFEAINKRTNSSKIFNDQTPSTSTGRTRNQTNSRKRTNTRKSNNTNRNNKANDTDSESSDDINSGLAESGRILHDLNIDDNCEEFVELTENKNVDSDDYTESDEEIEDYKVSFIWPANSSAQKIISICSINNEKYFTVLFNNGKVYFIKIEECKKNCPTLVNAFNAGRYINENTQYHNF